MTTPAHKQEMLESRAEDYLRHMVRPRDRYQTFQASDVKSAALWGLKQGEAEREGLQDQRDVTEEANRGWAKQSDAQKEEIERLRAIFEKVERYFSAQDLPSHCVTFKETMALREIAREALADLRGKREGLE